MEPTLVVIGISLRSAKLAQRERFLLTAAQKSEALTALVRSDAIDEVIVLFQSATARSFWSGLRTPPKRPTRFSAF